MRLARGSGLDGLAAMAPLTELAVGGAESVHALKVGRPLLEVPKARLRATLQERGIPWLEDPSNQQPAFERTRLRAAHARARGARSDDRDAGAERAPSATRPGSRGARRCRLLRARQVTCRRRTVRRHPHRRAGLAPSAGRDRRARHELGRRRSRRIAGADPPRQHRDAGRDALRRRCNRAPGRLLARKSSPRSIPSWSNVSRAGSRPPPSASHLAPRPCGTDAFSSTPMRVFPHPVEVRALGIDGVRLVRNAAALPSDVSADALRALPAFWHDGSLIAAPNLRFWPEEAFRGKVSATFLALGKYNFGAAAGQPRSS